MVLLLYNMGGRNLAGNDTTMSMATDPNQPQDPISLAIVAERPFGRAANWTVGIASAILVLVSVGGYFYHRDQLSKIAAENLRLIVTGPSTIQQGVAAEYMVSTKAISDRPLPAQIEVDILDPEGQRLRAYKEPVDEYGRLKVVIPADLKLPPRVSMTVVATHQKSREEATLTIQVVPVRPSAASVFEAWSHEPAAPVIGSPSPNGASKPVNVVFHPEGGSIVSGLENRVYFSACDAQGKPVQLAGSVVTKQRDEGSRDEEVALVQSSYEGQGVFGWIPRSDNTYRLKITAPKDVKDQPVLPEANKDGNVVLSAGSGVFAAGKPVEFNIRAAKSGLPLIAVAYCRDVQVGVQPLVTRVGATSANPVAIALNDSVSGVIRLAVFDYSVSPPNRVAERLVYRRAAPSLQIQTDAGEKKKFSPGEKVRLALAVRDEKNKPVSATIGVLLLDADNKASGERASTYELLTSRLAGGKNVSSADFLVSNDVKDRISAAVALDMVLGNQPASKGRGTPPLMFDNLSQIRSNYMQSMAEYQAGRTKMLNTLTTASFYGGLGLLLLVAMLGLMRIVTGVHLWLPTVGATTCCLIIGAILLDPSRLAVSQDAAVAFTPYCERSVLEKPSAKDTAIGPKNASRQILTTGPDGVATLDFALPADPSTLRILLDAVSDDRFGSSQINGEDFVPRGKK